MQHIKEIYEDVGTVEGHREAKGLVFGDVYGKAFFNLQHDPKIHCFAMSVRRNHKNILSFSLYSSPVSLMIDYLV